VKPAHQSDESRKYLDQGGPRLGASAQPTLQQVRLVQCRVQADQCNVSVVYVPLSNLDKIVSIVVHVIGDLNIIDHALSQQNYMVFEPKNDQSLSNFLLRLCFYWLRR
jgi:hypothetical protein